MTLKKKLEKIWDKPGVLNPCHINLWKWQDLEYTWTEKIGPVHRGIVRLKGRRTSIKNLPGNFRVSTRKNA